MASPPDPGRISLALRTALAQGFISADDTAVIFLDTGFIRHRMLSLMQAFPPSALHTVAVKANPLPAVLRLLAAQSAGAEAASLPEMLLALQCGFPPHRIVYDSPAKTRADIATALDKGVSLNADNLQELERIDEYLKGRSTNSLIGLRINPQVGTGSIAATSTAGAWSKFGVPLHEAHDEIRDAFLHYPWLNALHMHIGSQGISLEQLAEGAKLLRHLTAGLNVTLSQAGTNRSIRHLNIGGGLPVVYREGDPEISAQEYAAHLHQTCPEWFSGEFFLTTEFGRWTFANAGFTASRVEYLKAWGGRNTAILHVGADLFLRACYQPGVWHHQCLALDVSGILKQGSATPYTLAGPLCFSGDIPVPAVMLPPLQEGDWVVLRDTGAYTFSMWSRYNSRQMPVILGMEEDNITVLKPRESEAEVLQFWE